MREDKDELAVEQEGSDIVIDSEGSQEEKDGAEVGKGGG